MKSYIRELAEISKDEKCKHCVAFQGDLRDLMKHAEDWRLQEQIQQILRDHELHDDPGCDECLPQKAREAFISRNEKV